MVSAVFHSPLAAASESIAMKKEAPHADSTRRWQLKSLGCFSSNGDRRRCTRSRTPSLRLAPGLVMTVLPPLLGLGLLIGIWAHGQH
jgi:nitrate/nitrite transport system permease protein